MYTVRDQFAFPITPSFNAYGNGPHYVPYNSCNAYCNGSVYVPYKSFNTYCNGSLYFPYNSFYAYCNGSLYIPYNSFNEYCTECNGSLYAPYNSCMHRVSDPMLSPVPMSVHFLDYVNLGALFDIFLWSMCQNLCNLALVICLLI